MSEAVTIPSAHSFANPQSNDDYFRRADVSLSAIQWNKSVYSQMKNLNSSALASALDNAFKQLSEAIKSREVYSLDYTKFVFLNSTQVKSESLATPLCQNRVAAH